MINLKANLKPLLLVATLMSQAALAGGNIGFGVGLAPDYEGSDEREANPVLFGRYNWESGRYVAFAGTHEAGSAVRIKADLISDDMSRTWELGPVLQYRMKRDDVDNDRVDAMKDVDAATELGAFVGWKSGPWSANLSFTTDVSDEHDGSLAELKGIYTTAINDRLSLRIGASVSYADSDYMDTYFGVNEKNVGTSGLPFYDADSGLKDAGLSLTADYDLQNNWGLVGGIRYNRLLNDAADSPLVDDEGDRDQLSVTIAVKYMF